MSLYAPLREFLPPHLTRPTSGCNRPGPSPGTVKPDEAPAHPSDAAVILLLLDPDARPSDTDVSPPQPADVAQKIRQLSGANNPSSGEVLLAPQVTEGGRDQLQQSPPTTVHPQSVNVVNINLQPSGFLSCSRCFLGAASGFPAISPVLR
eukprot:superscaffoldBa00010882_g24939